MNSDYFKLPWHKKITFVIISFFKNLLSGIKTFCIGFLKFIRNVFVASIKGIKSFFTNFFNGDIITKLSYFILGIAHIFRGQVVRGILYFVLEVLFILFMVFFGDNYLSMFFENMFTGGNVGRVETTDFWNEELGIYDKLLGDNSFIIILYGVLTLLVIVFFLIIHNSVTNQSYQLQKLKENGKKPVNFKKDLSELFDNKFHFTLLAIPILGLLIFTISKNKRFEDSLK